MMEYEAFFELLQNADQYYLEANNVQKRMISRILLLNIVLDARKALQIQVRPGLEGLFSIIGNPSLEDFERIDKYIRRMRRDEIGQVIRFYLSMPNSKNNLTPRQKKYY